MLCYAIGRKSRGMIYAMRLEMAEYFSVPTGYGGSSRRRRRRRRIIGSLMAD